MKYMVMECHPGYAVVLDETGQFRKVANMRYEVGQSVTDVVELTLPHALPAKRRNIRWITSLAAVAACLIMLLIPSFMLPNVAYASVYITINPEVRIDVNRHDMVVGLEGVNADGEALIEGYSYQKKDLDTVVDELVDRSIQMGFLHEGGTITLSLDADDNEWVVSHCDSLGTHLDDYLVDKIVVTIEITENKNDTIIIPVEDDCDDDECDDFDDHDPDDDNEDHEPDDDHEDHDSDDDHEDHDSDDDHEDHDSDDDHEDHESDDDHEDHEPDDDHEDHDSDEDDEDHDSDDDDDEDHDHDEDTDEDETE